MPTCFEFSLCAVIMLPFDLSAMNILLVVAVTALFIFFIAVLMKLNPSTETETIHQKEVFQKKKPPIQDQPTTLPQKLLSPEKIASARAGAVETQPSVDKIVEEPPISADQENTELKMPEPERTVASAAETNSSSTRGCLHRFGYLRTLPKNKPIPDECLGCSRVVECLRNAKTRGE